MLIFDLFSFVVPPENVNVSNGNVYVKEHEQPERVKCSGRGRPKLSYFWRREGAHENASYGEYLQLDTMLRSDSGAYICTAFNKHGAASALVTFNVLCKCLSLCRR